MEAYFFRGQTPEVALVIAGIHGSELSGVEVARWLNVKLLRRLKTQNKLPNFTTLILPDIFPESTEQGRQCNDLDEVRRKPPLKQVCDQTQDGRFVLWPPQASRYILEPNRQFPPPGKPLSYLLQQQGPTDPDGNRITKDRDGMPIKGGVPLLPEIAQLINLIELHNPVRIVSIHAHSTRTFYDYGVDGPGVFVDPRYVYDKTKCQRNLLEPVGSKNLNTFGADIAKFDIDRDPAFPVIGLIKQMYDYMATIGNVPQAIKDDIENAVKTFREESKKKNPPPHPHVDSLAKAEAVAKKLEKLGFKRAQPRAQTAFVQKDDDLALQMAIAMFKKFPDLVPANHLAKSPQNPFPVLHYAGSAGQVSGFSLGDWGPVEEEGSRANKRRGAPVITVEIPRGGTKKTATGNLRLEDSGAFRGNLQLITEDYFKNSDVKNVLVRKLFDPTKFDKTRCEYLQAYADVLIDQFLE